MTRADHTPQDTVHHVMPMDARVDTSLRAALIGVTSAGTIIGGWLTLCAWLLLRGPDPFSLAGVAALGIMTHLSTGLFITAHDAMHGSVSGRWPRINRGLGALALALFALFPWRKMLAAHRKHHRFVGRDGDPDFHPPGVVAWYLRFLRSYLSWTQLLGMALLFNLLEHVVGVPLQRLLVFWVLPLVLSTWQLFYFGTYLPHRPQPAAWADEHRARSNDFAPWLSFLTCYHFGYHHEHHTHPGRAWWQLPTLRAQRREVSHSAHQQPL